ncbi:MAG TPA: DUF3047 domain-containing protein [Bdellovibrionota bacterium]|nr:DUF3047 domain-containing protein [Bdellovibrionota bacterium]
MPSRRIRAVWLVALCAASSAHAQQITTVLENFESFKEDETPSKGWDSRNGDPKKVYRIALENGNHYLSATDHGESVQLFRGGGWKLSETPRLMWKWRVNVFPPGADERLPDKNDSPAALYVVFPKRWLLPDVIKYVWSCAAPVETVIVKSKHFPLIVVRSGTSPAGKWVEESRNVYEDYKKLFDRGVPNPKAVGFLTDANAVKGTAAADYDELRLARESIKETWDP